jgi:hypothetical protein
MLCQDYDNGEIKDQPKLRTNYNYTRQFFSSVVIFEM